MHHPNKNLSNLIKITESSQKKSKRRLIGSIFMLLVALIILLNVTAKVKPIPINPTVIQIDGRTHSNASATSALANKQISSSAQTNTIESLPSTATAINPSPKTTTQKDTAIPGTSMVSSDQNKITASNSIITPKENITVSEKAEVTKVESPLMQDTTPSTIKHTLPKISPKIVSFVYTPKPSPEDLLNGNIPKPVKQYYVQLLGNHNKTKILAYQKQFEHANIKTNIESLKDGGYRLRIGPFSTQNAANARITKLLQNQ